MKIISADTIGNFTYKTDKIIASRTLDGTVLSLIIAPVTIDFKWWFIKGTLYSGSLWADFGNVTFVLTYMGGSPLTEKLAFEKAEEYLRDKSHMGAKHSKGDALGDTTP